MAYNVGTIEERFWQKVTKLSDDECWPWIANKNNKGYGMLYWIKYGRKILAHRVSHEIHNAPIDATMCVLHKCDNPPCCNPDHLFLGDAEVNAKDRESKGRGNQPVGFKNGKCKYNSDIKQIIVFKRYLGYTLKSLSHEFNMPIGTVSVIYLRSKENRATKMKAMGREHRIW